MAQEHPSVTKFREYLQIKTVHPDPDYDSAFEFLRKEAKEIGLEFRILNSGYEDKPVAVMTWRGTKPRMKSILLSSHIDVVPFFEEFWKYHPFSAHKDEEGNIFARGAQDMKCVTMWYLGAIRRLKSDGKSFPRTIHLLLTTDEETSLGPSRCFARSAAFQDLNAVFGLDEGMADLGEKITVFYGEKTLLCVEVTCRGNPGHGSQFVENTAGPKMSYMITKFHELRDEQEKKYRENPEKGLSPVITVNMTLLQGGVQTNVIPDQLSATFDVRVPPTQDIVALESRLNQWAMEAGPDVSVELNLEEVSSETVKLDSTNKFWTAFKEASKSLNIEVEPIIGPGSSDSRSYRKMGVDMLGFSPLTNTPIRAHDHNEYLNENVFLRGIDIYYSVISALASVED